MRLHRTLGLFPVLFSLMVFTAQSEEHCVDCAKIDSSIRPSCSPQQQQLTRAQLHTQGNELLRASERGQGSTMDSLQQGITDGLTFLKSCNPNLRCRDIKENVTSDLGNGWKRAIEIRAYDTDNGCAFSSPSMELTYQDQRIFYGNISTRSHRLTYSLPQSRCDTDGTEVSRSTVISERGIMIVDLADVRQNQGIRLAFNRLRTPTLHSQANGTLRVQLAKGAYLDIDPTTKLISESNLLDTNKMYGSSCATTFRRQGTRTVPQVSFPSNQAKRKVSRRFNEFGSSADERRANEYFRGMQREPIE